MGGIVLTLGVPVVAIKVAETCGRRSTPRELKGLLAI